MPSENDLCVALVVLIRQLCKYFFLHKSRISMPQRIPAHKSCAIFLKPLHDGPFRAVRVCFQLNDMRHDLCFCQQLLQLFIMEVGDAEGFCFPFFVGLFQLSVSSHKVSGRLVDKEKIHIVESQTGKRSFHCIFILIKAGPEFCGNEYLFPGNDSFFKCFLQSLADGFFVHIGIGGVDHAVSEFQSRVYCFFGIFRTDHKSADADHGDLNAVAECDIFHGIASFMFFSILYDSQFTTENP